MTDVLLDIGAGSTEFVKQFRSLNRSLNFSFLCGEPEWNGGYEEKPRWGKIRTIRSRYDSFALPDRSVRIVTLNAFHPLMPPGPNLVNELVRTLIPDGLFISAHPVGMHPSNLPEDLLEPIKFTVSESSRRSYELSFVHAHRCIFFRLPMYAFETCGLQVFYPASGTIRSRLHELRLPEEFRNRSEFYCYAQSEAVPTVRVWRRTEKPTP